MPRPPKIRVPHKIDGQVVPNSYLMADATPETPCLHLGEQTGEKADCLPCNQKTGGRVQLKLTACAVHGQCWPGRQGETKDPGEAVRWCARCEEYEPRPRALPAIVTRNLLYHICPFSGNGIWQRNVGQLLKRIRLFNGRRVVAIATGIGLDPPEHVEDLFDGRVHEFVHFENEPRLREVKPFLDLLGRVHTDDAAQATFYGHAKGVTHPGNWQIEKWTDMMYETCLDYWPLVERVLQNHALAGSFKKTGPAFEGSQSRWHYSGTFFWFRNRDAFARSWKTIDRVWWGAEAWPGLVFSPAEAGVLFKEANLDLYHLDTTRAVAAEFEQWKVIHAGAKR